MKFLLPGWVRHCGFTYGNFEEISVNDIEELKRKLDRFKVDNPQVSIIIPAYNEEKYLYKTLLSISNLQTKYKTELIVINNNSTDGTQKIIEACSVKSVLVAEKGVSYARQAGLEHAKGEFILNADADSIYPPGWIDAYVDTLKNKSIACVYGSYAFIPDHNNSRISLGFYELFSKSISYVKKRNRECVNVMGFNFAFRKEDAIKVGGFKHDLDRKNTGRCEDGWMAYCLMTQGKIKVLESDTVKVWTSTRRLMDDGSVFNAFNKRVKKELGRLYLYINPKFKIRNIQ